jgi:hypothetical protein
MEENKSIKKSVRLDVIIIAVLLLVALLWLGFSLIFRKTGGYVAVEVDGVLVAEYSLSLDGEYAICDTNVLVIENGCAYMKDASCPDKTCVGVGRVKYAGQSIICLPNRVAVTVMGEGDLDLIS